MKLTLILLLFLWDNVEFTLTLEECSQVPTVEHAFVSDEYKKAEYQKGDVIYFSCDPGYTTGLNTTYICTEDGWRAMTIGPCFVLPDGDSPPVRLSCARPPALKNGHVLQRANIYVYEDSNKVTYQCDDLYVLMGGHFKTCSNGQWTGDLQCIQMSCLKPQSENFIVEEEKTVYKINEVLKYSCIVGYRKVNQTDPWCQRLGYSFQWTPIPRCEQISCGHPGDVQFADFELVRGEDYNFGSQVQYTCHKGYQMTSYTSTRNCLEQGWDGHLPECEQISCLKPKAENFIVEEEKTEYKINEVLKYYCIVGYRKVIQTDPWCQRLGYSFQWTPIPRCEQISCGHPGDVQFADFALVRGEDYNFGSQVQYTCHKGYQMTSYTSTRNCLEQGWDGHLPECERASVLQ